jgi:hypothetical protein
LLEKKPGACSDEMLTRRDTPNITHASTTVGMHGRDSAGVQQLASARSR